MAKVGFVCGDFLNPEVLGGSFDQRDEVRSVVCGPTAYVNGGDDLGIHAAHQMRLYPLSVVHFSPVLLVEPPDVTARAEAQRVYCEVSLYGLQGQATSGDEFLEHARKLRVRDVAVDRVEVRGAVYVATNESVPQVAGKASGREVHIHFVDRSEEHI